MVDRRSALKVLGAVPVAATAGAGLSFAASDENNVSIDLWMSDSSAGGFLQEPDTEPAGSVILIHEWWGLNQQIRNVVTRFAEAGYLALGVDLYQGKVAQTPESARAFMQDVHPDIATETLVSWVEWLRNHPKSNGKVGTVGWCFGGGWSLNTAIATPVEASVIYYGRCAKGPDEVKTIKGPIMGHFATEDNFIDRDMVQIFENSMNAAGKTYQNFWYEADHAFANPTSQAHDSEDAALAWTRTLEFFQQHLT